MQVGVTASVVWRMGIAITFCVGLSALLVSTDWAMREPLLRGTGNRTGSTFEPELYFVDIDYQYVTDVHLMY